MLIRRPFHRDTKSDVKILIYPDRTTSSAPDSSIASRTRDSCSMRLSNPEIFLESGIEVFGNAITFACAPATRVRLVANHQDRFVNTRLVLLMVQQSREP